MSPDDEYTRRCGANQANLARYVYDDHGSCCGRCLEHDRGIHHPLCRDSDFSVAERGLIDLRIAEAAAIRNGGGMSL